MADEKGLVYVLMPSGTNNGYARRTEADHVYQKIIKPAVFKALGENIAVIREIDTPSPGLITRNIIRRIASAYIVIVDITGRNPNVFLELGIRHALRSRITIIMHQTSTDIPFDIAGFRSIPYDSFEIEETIEKIVSSISEAVMVMNTDSVVYEVYPNMDVTLNDGLSPSDGMMPWRDYWGRVKAISEKLREALVEGRYVPDVVIGITNGGALFADLLERQVVYRCPIVSLWANRTPDFSESFFNNEINEAICGVIKKLTKPSLGGCSSGTKILLVDDVISTGFTYSQAIKFLREKVPNCEIRFLPLCYRETQKFEFIKDIIIWSDSNARFDLDKEAIDRLHLASWHRFPYEKDIKSM